MRSWSTQLRVVRFCIATLPFTQGGAITRSQVEVETCSRTFAEIALDAVDLGVALGERAGAMLGLGGLVVLCSFWTPWRAYAGLSGTLLFFEHNATMVWVQASSRFVGMVKILRNQFGLYSRKVHQGRNRDLDDRRRMLLQHFRLRTRVHWKFGPLTS